MKYRYERWVEITPGSGNYYIWHYETLEDAERISKIHGGIIKKQKVAS